MISGSTTLYVQDADGDVRLHGHGWVDKNGIENLAVGVLVNGCSFSFSGDARAVCKLLRELSDEARTAADRDLPAPENPPAEEVYA